MDSYLRQKLLRALGSDLEGAAFGWDRSLLNVDRFHAFCERWAPARYLASEGKR